MVLTLALGGAILLAQDVAQAATGGGFDWTSLVDIGVIGIVLFLILTKRLAPYWVVEHERERAEKAEGQRDRLIETFQSDVVPSLTRASDALSRISTDAGSS